VSGLVVDASVAVKWLPPFDQEPLAAQAQGLLDRWERGQLEIMIPDLIWPEIANVFWKSVRLKRCTVNEAEAALAAMHSQNLLIFSSASLIDLAFRIAIQYERTAYDSLCIALAVTSNCQLVTADEKLANAVAAYLPVKWLGAF
jgi:predicted nucleic acid-binding protein